MPLVCTAGGTLQQAVCSFRVYWATRAATTSDDLARDAWQSHSKNGSVDQLSLVSWLHS
jgi:hypothetical protein